VETMEHLLCECEHYSELVERLATSNDTHTTIQPMSTDRVLRVELGQTNVIYNIPHLSLLLHIPDKTMRNTLLH
jgi:hypothetical protein